MELDQKALIEKSKTNLEDFLQRESRSLVTFTGDPELEYIPEPEGEKFRLEPREGALYLPLASFLENELDYTMIMWHIYYNLALYPDWKKHPEKYLNRTKNWQGETDSMTGYILRKVEKSGFKNDPAYQPEIIAGYVIDELLGFLWEIDRIFAYLRVQQTSPVYRDDAISRQTGAYIKDSRKPKKGEPSPPLQREFINAIWNYELDGEISDMVSKAMLKPIMGQPLVGFMHYQLVSQIPTAFMVIRATP